MNFLAAANTEPTSWDRFVASQLSGHFFQSHAWGQFQRRLGWEPRYCTLSDSSGLRAAALVLERSVPGVGRVAYAPRGPVVDPRDADTTDALLDALYAPRLRRRGVLALRSLLDRSGSGAHTAGFTRVPRDWSQWNGPRFVLWLDLSGDEDAVMQRASSRCRNDIRRGYKNDVVFTQGGEEDIDDFYRLMILTGNQKGIAFHGPDYYRDLYRTVNQSAKVQLFVGRLDGVAITVGMSVAYGRKAWLLYAASAPEHYKLRANRTLQWEMIKWAHAEGCERYDFRGSATLDPPSPSDPGYGVYEFKNSFGPEFVRLTGYYDVVRSPMRYRMFRLAEERLLPAAYRMKTWLQERRHGGAKTVAAPETPQPEPRPAEASA